MSRSSQFTDEQCKAFSYAVRHREKTIKELSEEYKIAYNSMANYVRRGDRLLHDMYAEKLRYEYDVSNTLAPYYKEFSDIYLFGNNHRLGRYIQNILDRYATLDQLKSPDIKAEFERIITGLDLGKEYFGSYFGSDANLMRRSGSAMFVMWFQLTKGEHILDRPFYEFIKTVHDFGPDKHLLSRLVDRFYFENRDSFDVEATVREVLPIFLSLDPHTVSSWRTIGKASVKVMSTVQQDLKKIAEEKGWVY